MDSRLHEQLEKLDEHIKRLFLTEKEFLVLDATKKSLLAELTRQADGKSHAERESIALSSQDWKDFAIGHANKEAEFNREKRRYELLVHAFNAAYSTMKIEAQMIKKQL